MRVTPNFTMAEFAVSARHPDLVRPVPSQFATYARLLAVLALQPMRDAVDRPLQILSGYRAPELNRAVDGSSSSQHTLAQAVDVTAHESEALMRWMVENKPAGIGQVIYYPARQFLHVGLVTAKYPQFAPFLSPRPKQYDLLPPTRDALDAALTGRR
jgi:hypothetical protein